MEINQWYFSPHSGFSDELKQPATNGKTQSLIIAIRLLQYNNVVVNYIVDITEIIYTVTLFPESLFLIHSLAGVSNSLYEAIEITISNAKAA